MTCPRCRANRSPSARVCMRCGLRFGERLPRRSRRGGPEGRISPARRRRLKALAWRWLPAVAAGAVVSAAVQLGMFVLGLRGYSAPVAGLVAALATAIFTVRPKTRRSWLATPVAALLGTSLASIAAACLGTGLVEVPQGELLIGGATLALAVATLWLGALTGTSELERRREAQILDAHPLVVVVEGYSPADVAHPRVLLRARTAARGLA